MVRCVAGKTVFYMDNTILKSYIFVYETLY
jgi:hypothetical protein